MKRSGSKRRRNPEHGGIGITGLLTAVGTGAALMYILDPERGYARRTEARQRLYSWLRRGRRAVERKIRDARNRAQGAVYEFQRARRRVMGASAPTDWEPIERMVPRTSDLVHDVSPEPGVRDETGSVRGPRTIAERHPGSEVSLRGGTTPDIGQERDRLEIPRAEWRRFFDGISRELAGSRIDVETIVNGERKPLQHDLPLGGIGADTKDNENNVVITVDGDGDGHATHIIVSACRVEVGSDPGGSAIEVEAADGTVTLLRLHDVDVVRLQQLRAA